MIRPRAASWQVLGVWGTYSVIVATGAVLVVRSIVGASHFLAHAPLEFWLLAIIALVVELRPLTIPHDQRSPTRVAVSLCLTFAIMLLWGSAVAIVVQTLAIGVAALRERRPLSDVAFDVARFSLAFLVAGWVESRIVGEPRLGMDIDEFGGATVVLVPLVWFLVDNGVIAVMLTAAGRAIWRRWAGPPLYYYQIATAGLLMLAPALIIAPTGWAVALFAVPLALFGLVARVLRVQERNLNRDPSSQLRNMRGLAVSVDQLLAPGSSTYPTPRLGLLLVRLSGVGDVTNSFGRLVSDHLVDRVGTLLTADMSSDAIIGRIASADVVVLLPNADIGQIERAADRIAQTLTAPIDVDGVVFLVRPIIGIATAPADGTELGALTAQAERAIMDARRTGAMVRTIPAGDETEARRHLALLTDLRASIQQPGHADELFVLYQPQVRIDDGQVIGVEALVRWRHPERGTVDTADMILTAEASGVIQLLTLRVLDDVLSQLEAWKDAGLQLRVSVNVSAKDFASTQFADQVRLRLTGHAIAPEQLVLEITESALVTPSPSVDRTVADLAAMGVELSLDDFGTGFASLQQIRRYPLHELKIDRSYVAAMTASLPDRAMVTTISQLALQLGLRVVAEGVEDARTAHLLGQIGPIVGQGWHFGHPMSGPDLLAWIRARPDGS